MTLLPYRLAAISTAFLLLTAVALVLTSGCVIYLTHGPGPDGTGGSGGEIATPPPPDFTGAGQGGACPAGSSGAGNPGIGGGGGTCVGLDGTGETAEICDTMEITPSKSGGPAASNCDRCGGTAGTHVPPGYALCLAGFEVFTAGSAENLRACLAQINGAPAFACDLGPVADCLTGMYHEACPSQAAADTCQLIRGTLCGLNEPFDAAACSEELKPFNNEALQRVADCAAYSGEADCQKAYTACFNQITSY